MSMLNFGKSVTLFGLFCLSSGYFVWMHRHQSFNIAPKTTGVEDTYPMLKAIRFHVKVNNSSKNLAFSNIREKVWRVSVSVETIIPFVCLLAIGSWRAEGENIFMFRPPPSLLPHPLPPPQLNCIIIKQLQTYKMCRVISAFVSNFTSSNILFLLVLILLL